MDNEVACTIPHMHLFMELKRRFPELKDADITDCIQRFGLHKSLCEQELNRRIQEHQRNYNSPWNLSRTSSRSSTASRTSPHSNSDTPLQISSPLPNGSSPSTPPRLPSPTTPSSQQMSGSGFSDSEDELPQTKPVAPHGVGQSNFIRPSNTGDVQFPNTIYLPAMSGNSQHSNSNNLIDKNLNMVSPSNVIPKSAPIISLTSDPFTYVPRRSSAESESERLKRILQSQNIAGIQEQLTRKEKLQEQLNRRLEEKSHLEEEVKKLSDELETREINQRLDVEKCKKRIEFIQHENSRLQFVCDEMEREILESGETPKTDQEWRRPSLQEASLPNYIENPSSRRPPIAILNRASSASSLSSGAGTPATPVMPSRRAPTPPSRIPKTPPAGPIHEPDQSMSPSHGNQHVQTTNEDGGWACSKCTFDNSPYLDACEMCGHHHFPVGTPPITNPQSHAGGPCYCHHRHHSYNVNHDNHGTVHPSP